jgi:UDP-glucose 4-epimerase
MAVLITGGAGYIGSHACLTLLQQNFNIVILDDLSNSSLCSMQKLSLMLQVPLSIKGGGRFVFYEGSINNRLLLKSIFKNHKIDSVLHLAGLKSVADSVINPLQYYQTNIAGSLTLFEEMVFSGVKKLVFSSSATVYKQTSSLPLTEDSEVGDCLNPYGNSKLVVESILSSLYDANIDFSICILRYFNPVGAHYTGVIGENPKGKPNNIMPIICDVAVGETQALKIFGSDYPTKDGTALRDYIHINDLIDGHVAALRWIEEKEGSFGVFNLGTGRSTSVLELIQVFEKVNKVIIPFEFEGRRRGDVGECWASPSKAAKELNWKAKMTIEDMCRDSFNWKKLK